MQGEERRQPDVLMSRLATLEAKMEQLLREEKCNCDDNTQKITRLELKFESLEITITDALKGLKTSVDSLTSDRHKLLGAMGVIAVLGGFVLWVADKVIDKVIDKVVH